jgi:hypothetical protein
MVEGINSNVIYLIYYKNFCKCPNVLPSSPTIKNYKLLIKIKYYPDMVVHASNVSTGEVEALVLRAQGQPGLHIKTLSQKSQNQKLN